MLSISFGKAPYYLPSLLFSKLKAARIFKRSER